LTKEYIRDFERIAEANSGDGKATFEQMMSKHPERFNPGALLLGVKVFMMATERARLS